MMPFLLDAYERGYQTGRMAGLEQACNALRELPYSEELAKLIETLTREKYREPQL
jgi:flagellar biosynthesis/type III secretory pathway protein FliH